MSNYRRWYRRFFSLESAEERAGGERKGGGSTPGRAAAGAGAEMAGGILMFAGIGYLVDRWLGTWPWGVLVGCLLGLFGGMYLVIQATRRM
ncbi:MAG: AtpZ/AtpI family protein [Phycisphaeraceae bacterium]